MNFDCPVLISSPVGEILFVVAGVILQVASIICESVRLTLVQILLQSRGIKVCGSCEGRFAEQSMVSAGVQIANLRQKGSNSHMPGLCLHPSCEQPVISICALQMNPISSLYHIAPCCFVFLALPFTYIELPRMVNDPDLKINVPLLLMSAMGAFGERQACGRQSKESQLQGTRDSDQ
jgi:hypothetical protein